MDATTIDLMRDQVRAIYRALTGQDLSEETPPSSTSASATGSPEAPVSADEVARAFAQLETIARTIPSVAERVPPFSFAPPLDAIDIGGELLIEVGVPGIEKKHVQVELTGELLTVGGFREGQRATNGHTYYRAELPRGPFHRVIRLPCAVVDKPRVEVEHGLIRIRLTKITKAAAARA